MRLCVLYLCFLCRVFGLSINDTTSQSTNSQWITSENATASTELMQSSTTGNTITNTRDTTESSTLLDLLEDGFPTWAVVLIVIVIVIVLVIIAIAIYFYLRRNKRKQPEVEKTAELAAAPTDKEPLYVELAIPETTDFEPIEQVKEAQSKPEASVSAEAPSGTALSDSTQDSTSSASITHE